MADKTKSSEREKISERIKKMLDRELMLPGYVILKNTFLKNKRLSPAALLIIRLLPFAVILLLPADEKGIAIQITEASCFSLVLPAVGQCVCRLSFCSMKLKTESFYDILALIGTLFFSFIISFFILKHVLKKAYLLFPEFFAGFAGLPLAVLIFATMMIIYNIVKTRKNG